MTDLNKIVRAYAAFEKDVAEVMNAYCAPCCSVCPQCCCRYDVCEESQDSPFLRLVQKTDPPEDYFDERYGWLSTRGCLLKVGRPPICYEYLCDELLSNFIDEDDREALKTLGSLIQTLGENTYGDTHLVDLREESFLLNMQFNVFEKRLGQLYNVLDGVKAHLAKIDFS